MPSPIAHAAIGYVIYRLAVRENSRVGVFPHRGDAENARERGEASTRVDRAAPRSNPDSGARPALKALASPGALLLLASVLFSLLPDFDALPGLVFGEMYRFHNQFSHSLLVGLGAALAAGLLTALFAGRQWAWSVFLVALLGYEMHILADLFTYESRGVMLFWPLTPERFTAPVKLFYGVRWSEGVFSPLHLITLTSELVFSAVLLAGTAWLAGRRAHLESAGR